MSFPPTPACYSASECATGCSPNETAPHTERRSALRGPGRLRHQPHCSHCRVSFCITAFTEEQPVILLEGPWDFLLGSKAGFHVHCDELILSCRFQDQLITNQWFYSSELVALQVSARLPRRSLPRSAEGPSAAGLVPECRDHSEAVTAICFSPHEGHLAHENIHKPAVEHGHTPSEPRPDITDQASNRAEASHGDDSVVLE